ncbi:putative disease resistance RPP13-like protein 3 [Mangifera indica]|uniref:putative disease resistance RPP13-like protein 3 n=1 Tax=Mangifera indica TaxID=29780 RepID=UPI001CFA3093|nr:putative disease resistance RPP13-like protein 3 [Mangifera indica]
MVDAVVTFVLNRVGDYLIKEAALLSGVRGEVESLKKELEWMSCFMKDAEDKQVDSPLIRQWVSDIREIAYDFEDVLDESMLHVGDKDEEGESPEGKHGLFSAIKKWVAKCSRKGREKVTTYNIGKKIESLKTRLSDVSRRCEFYGLRDINIKRDEDNLARRRHVISIWGTGGLGKTTLAGKLYKSSAIKGNFDCCAWVSVSQHFNIEDLLQRIIKSFGFSAEKLERMSEEDLERYVHESLQGRKYLVVIDDVWQKEAWASLKRAFPDNENGSRLIITTRIRDVAERSDERTCVHELRFLKPDESWQLFCQKAFSNLNIDEGLEKLGREMVEKCRGLPLAIVILGGLLSTKKPQEWNLLCFLYLRHFLEDRVIITDKLIRLWVAEGYIPHNKEIMEDVARSYLNELINRSLIQKEKTRLGKVVKCRIHDLLRELMIQKATELNFIQTYDEMKNSAPHSSMLSCRRQAIYSGMKGTAWLQQCNPLLRCLLFFDLNKERPTMSQFVSTLCKTFKFLRVLEFAYFRRRSSWSLPKDIDKLIHLKYLSLRDTGIYHIPE